VDETILVLVGTGEFGCDRLVKKMDEVAGELSELVVVQYGNGVYRPVNCLGFDFTGDLSELYDRARLVVSTDGAGRVFECLLRKLKLVLVVGGNDRGCHDLALKFSEEGFCYSCSDLSELRAFIDLAGKTRFREYVAPECLIGDRIVEFMGGGK